VEQALALRPAGPDDVAFLFRVYASTRTEELAPVPWSDEQKRAFLAMQFDVQDRYYRAQFPGAVFQVILLDGRPAGRLYVDHRDEELRIIDIALLPEHRGAGVGGTLVRGLLDEATQAGKPVRIHVERFNPALRLYARLGFERVADTGIYFLLERSPARPRGTASAPPSVG
jgi:ribosomal protein S18 acetylase RimI-like enzyme